MTDNVQVCRHLAARISQVNVGRRGGAYILFTAGFAIILAGFWPTFYGNPASNDFMHTLHGIASTLWVLLLIAQSLLIGRGNRRLHEKLGWLSLILFAVLFTSSGYMVWVELVGTDPFPRDLRLGLTLLDVMLLALFAAIYRLGFIYRRQARLHVRLMGSTILIGLQPGLARLYAERIPGLGGLAGALPWTFWTVDSILIVMIVLELRRGEIMWPFPAMLAVFAVIQLGYFWAPGDTFASMAKAAGAPI